MLVGLENLWCILNKDNVSQRVETQLEEMSKEII